jgi:hypothetical protein
MRSSSQRPLSSGQLQEGFLKSMESSLGLHPKKTRSIIIKVEKHLVLIKKREKLIGSALFSSTFPRLRALAASFLNE